MDIKKRQLEIINATGELLTLNGVGGFTIKNLAAKMGFAESAVYRHFSGKEEIIVTMLNYFFHIQQKRLGANDNFSNDPEQQIRDFYKKQTAFFNKHPHFLIAILSEGLFEENDEIKETIKKLMNTTRQHLIQIVGKGQQEEIFTSDIPAAELVHIIMGSFRMLMLQWKMNDFSFNLTRRANQLTDSILKLIMVRREK